MALIHSPANAEIYQSTDAQGNTVYSDRPSQGAEEIKVPQTNSADAIVESPRPATEEKASITPRKASARPDNPAQRQTDDEYLYYDDDNYDGRLDDRTRRKERRDDDGVAQPKIDRPGKAERKRNVQRPTPVGRGRR